MADAVQLVQTTLAPAFLVTGAAVFLNFCQGRLFRVVDRLRADSDPAQQAIYLRRARILRNAIVLGATAVALTLLTALGILLTSLWGDQGSGLVLLAFAGAMVALVGSAVLAVFDTVLSVAFAERQALRERRAGE